MAAMSSLIDVSKEQCQGPLDLRLAEARRTPKLGRRKGTKIAILDCDDLTWEFDEPPLGGDQEDLEQCYRKFQKAVTNGSPIGSLMSNVENLSPQIIRRVVKEMTELATKPPEGIKVSINEEDISDIQAYIEGPAGTPYAGGVFKVKLALGKDFPQTPPKAFFLTKIFHPNVAKNGEICVNTLKKDWKPDLGIKHILLTVKCLLIVPNAESALNEEAGKLLLEQYECYSQRAKMMTEIHALSTQFPKSGLEVGTTSTDGPMAKKHAGDKKIAAEKKKLLKDKKRTLKRL